MDQLVSLILDKRVLILLIAILVLIIIYLIYRRIVFNRLKNRFDELLVDYNSIKSVPLNFKLNKAVAIAKTNAETMDLINRCQDDYNKIQNNFNVLADLMAETDDNITIRKNKLIKNNITDLENCIEMGKTQVSKLESLLDSILERENELRNKVNDLKDEYGAIKLAIRENSNKLNFAFNPLDNKVIGIEQQFSIFEEYMYASEFEKAEAIIDDINNNVKFIENAYEKLPTIIENARGVIPNLIDEIKRIYALSMQRGVYLNHINVETNLDTVSESLKSSLAAIEKLKLDNVEKELADITTRLQQMYNMINSENTAFIELKDYFRNGNKEINDIKDHLNSINEMFPKVESRFGFDLKNDVEKYNNEYLAVVQTRDICLKEFNSYTKSANEVKIKVDDLKQRVAILYDSLSKLNDKLIQATSDEQRARKQLMKLELITNEMKVKIVKNKLPKISKQFNTDMMQATEQIHTLNELLNSIPLNIDTLNYELNKAIDFIYKLYNNVNNVVGMALMAENTIVFGNKYRSIYPEIDSDLTRAELCFRNGEYTQALELAIKSIEGLFPNNYDTLIKENSVSAK